MIKILFYTVPLSSPYHRLHFAQRLIHQSIGSIHCLKLTFLQSFTPTIKGELIIRTLHVEITTFSKESGGEVSLLLLNCNNSLVVEPPYMY